MPAASAEDPRRGPARSWGEEEAVGAPPAGGVIWTEGVVPPDEGIRDCDVLPVNRTMKKYKICVTIILNFLLVIF